MANLNLPGIALVTGASKGIGRATCVAFAIAGVKGLVLSGRNESDLQITAKEAQSRATNPEFEYLIVAGDISIEADIINLVSKGVSHFGRIDYAVNNAGFIAQKFKPFADVPTEELDALTNTNQRGTFLCTREEIRAMKQQTPKEVRGLTATASNLERGSIVNISSTAAVTPLLYSASYNPTTWARNGISKSAAIDHAADSIRVNCVLATYTISEGFAAHPDGSPELAATLTSQNPMKRLATPADIADAVVFLSSPLASFVTGVSLVVDGGRTLV